MSFKHLQLTDAVLKALEHEGYSAPTPIQEKSIPVILQGRDLLGCAQTGTGKTAAFAIPLLQLLQTQKEREKQFAPGIRALVLTPTRELAIQVSESFNTYGKYLSLRQMAVFGGVPLSGQVAALRRGVDILIATPGRLLDLMNQRLVSLQHLQYLVLDEADRMLDMGFIHDVKKIISKLPAQRQTVFFSATMPSEILRLSATLLQQPVKVEVTPVASTAELIDQSIYYVERQNKRSLLIHLLKEKGIKTALVFARTKHGADKIARDLTRAGIRSEAIHGNKSQGARQAALRNFKNGATRILVATDIAARGIDIDKMGHVINYELPEVPETYVHRIGRTGRAGSAGVAISFCDYEEKVNLIDIQKLIKKTISVVKDHPFDLPHLHPGEKLPANTAMSYGARAAARGKRKGRTSFRQRA